MSARPSILRSLASGGSGLAATDFSGGTDDIAYALAVQRDKIVLGGRTGTNTGRAGTGKRVRISGYELWQFDNAGLIENSKGHFDSAKYERQLKHGVDG